MLTTDRGFKKPVVTPVSDAPSALRQSITDNAVRAELLLSVAGTVYTDGSTITASGDFTVSHPGTGLYNITFDRAICACAATLDDADGGGVALGSVTVVVTDLGTVVSFKTFNPANALANRAFSFVAVPLPT